MTTKSKLFYAAMFVANVLLLFAATKVVVQWETTTLAIVALMGPIPTLLCFGVELFNPQGLKVEDALRYIVFIGFGAVLPYLLMNNPDSIMCIVTGFGAWAIVWSDGYEPLEMDAWEKASHLLIVVGFGVTHYLGMYLYGNDIFACLFIFALLICGWRAHRVKRSFRST